MNPPPWIGVVQLENPAGFAIIRRKQNNATAPRGFCWEVSRGVVINKGER